MNFNNSKSSGYSANPNIQYYQDSHQSFINGVPTGQQSQEQSEQKQSYENRNLQCYCQKEGTISNTIPHSRVAYETTTRTSTTLKEDDSHHVHISEMKPCTAMEPSESTFSTTDHSTDYTTVSDQVFIEMLSRAFQGTDKLRLFLNDKDKIMFLRHYTGLIDRLSYAKLQLQQWNYYYHLGVTQNIWTVQIPEDQAEKNSICHTYGRSKITIQQGLKIFQEQLEETQNAIQLYENEVALKAGQHIDCSADMKILFLIINAFVSEHQRKLRDEFEDKRRMLVLDATDHHLVKKFFDLKPSESQIASARRIWQATVKQTSLEEQISVLEHRRTARAVSSSSNLFDRILDSIDTQIAESVGVMDLTAFHNFIFVDYEKLNQLKQDIIQQSIKSGRAMITDYVTTIHSEKQNFFIETDDDEHIRRMHIAILDATELRRLHMIKRANYVTQQKLLSYFKQPSS